MKNKKKLIIIIVIISIVALLLIGGGTTAIIMSNQNVNEKHIELDINDNQSFTYDGLEHKPVINNLKEIDESKVSYYFKDKDNSQEGDSLKEGLPKDAGNYSVVISYLDVSKVITMTIEKASLTLSDLTCEYNNPNGDYFTSETNPKDIEFLYTFKNASNTKIDGSLSLDTDSFTPSVSSYSYTFIPNDSNYSSYQGTIDLDIYATVYLYEGDTLKDYLELPFNSLFEYELNKRDGYLMPYITLEDGTVIDDTFKITDDINLYYVENVESFIITYNLDGGVNGNNPLSYTMFDALINLDDASKTGYKFLGWYTDGEFAEESKITEIDPNSLVNYNLYAKFEWIKINPMIQFNDLNLVYTGQAQTLLDVNVDGGTITYSLDEINYANDIPTGINAGNYTVYYKVKGDSYHLNTSGTRIVKIQKAVYDMSAITMTDRTVTYNGTEQGITISGTLPDGVSVAYSGLATNAGTYQITAVFTGDVTNYEAIDSMTATLTIEKADLSYTLPESKNLVFNDANQELIIPGSISQGTIEYSLDDENYSETVPTGKNIGSYVVYYRYVVDETNYNSISSGYVSTFISQGEVDYVIPVANDLTYTGNLQDLVTPGSINVGEIEYSLNGVDYDSTIPQGLNAGAYEVHYHFVYDKANYATIEDGVVLVTINKANITLTAPTAKTLTYNGTAQELVNEGTVSAGTIEYSLDGTDYSTNIPVGTNAGEYTVYYRVIGNANYNDIAADTINVTIAKATYDMSAISMTDRTVTYDGSEQGIEITGELPEGVSVAYSGLGTNAGTYQIIATFTGDAANYEAIDALTATLTINKADAVLTVPTGKTLTYNGSAQALVVAGITTGGQVLYSLDNVSFDLSVPTAIDAGEYTVYYKVDGGDNYNDILVDTVIVTIAKASITKVNPKAKALTYTGEAQELVIDGTSSAGTIEYSLDGIEYSSNIPTGINAGAYTVYYQFVLSNNYNPVDGGNFVVTIAKANITLTAPTAKTLTYNGSAQELVNAGVVSAGTIEYSLDGTDYSSNIPTGVNAGEYTVYYRVIGNANYNDIAADTVIVTIAKATYDMSAISMTDRTVTYDGNEQGIEITGELPEGVSVAYSGLGTNAGTYQITATFTGDAANYEAIDALTATLTINKADAVLTAPTAKTLTYNGSAQELVNEGAVSAGTIEYSLDGTDYSTSIPVGTNAGEYTVYYRVIGNANYNDIAADTVNVTIAKATYDMSAISMTDRTVTYDGNEQGIEITGELPEGVSVAYSGLGTNAGTYQITATFTGDAANYEAIDALTATLTINKADAVLTAPTAKTLTYNGSAQELVNEGAVSAGTIEYSLDGTVYSSDIPTGVNAGTYTVYYRVVLDEENYNSIEANNVQVIIGLATITGVTVNGYNGQYDGNPHNVVLSKTATTVDDSLVTWTFSLDGETYQSEVFATLASDSGTYYYKASANNHIDVTGSFLVVISDKNATTISISNLDSLSKEYDGEEIATPNVVTNSDGDITITYSVDGETYSTNKPVAAGDYRIKVDISETTHYTMASQVFVITIFKKVLTVNGIVVNNKTYDGTTNATVSNYGTLVGIVGTDDVMIDTTAIIANFASDMPANSIVVTLSGYALSGLESDNYTLASSWTATANIEKANVSFVAPTAKTLTYDGSTQELINEGTTNIGTIEYSLDGSEYSANIPTETNAGNYTVYYRVVLDLDKYNEIPADSILVTIAKAKISITAPAAKALTYTGNAQELVTAGVINPGTITYSLDDSNYDSIIPTGVNAGSYTVYYEFTIDTSNYEIVGEATGVVNVTIAKATYDMSAISMTDKTVTYDGNEQGIEITGELPEGVSVAYSGLGTNAGTYQITATFTGDATNYEAIDSMTATLSIAKATATAVLPTAKTLTYDGTAQALINAGSTNAGTIEYSLDNSNYTNTVPTGVNAGSYTVYYRFTLDSTNYDTTAISNGNVSVTIAKATYDMSAISMIDRIVTYDGNEQGIEITGELPEGVSVAYSGLGTNVGYYEITATFTGDVTNYEAIDEMIAILTIVKAQASVTAPSAKTLTYDGSAQALVNAGSSLAGTIAYSTNGTNYYAEIPTGVNAGSYTVYYEFTIDTSNYEIVGEATGVVNVTIAKATYDMSAISMTDKTVTYDGNEQGIEITGELPEGVSVAYSGLGTNAGTYQITATFTGDATNYEAIDSMTATLTIAKATATAVLPTANTLTYDGTAQALINAGSTNAGTIEYSLDNSNYTNTVPTGVNAGSYTVYYRFTLDSTNYDTTAISNGNVSVTIAKAAATAVLPTAKTLTYTGATQALITAGSTNAGTIEYSLDNSNYTNTVPTGVNAGSYTVYYRFTLDSTNYDTTAISNGNVSVTIAKAAATLVLPTAKALTYNGSDQALINIGTATVGTLEYSIDDVSYNVAVPKGKNAGNYTVYYRFTLDTTNYDTQGVATNGSLVVTISKASVTATTPTAKALTYTGNAQALINTGSISVGTIEYSLDNSNYSSTVPTGVNAGSYTVYYRYTYDTVNYEGALDGSVVVAIAKATPTYTIPTGLSATPTMTLADITLPTGFAFSDPLTTSVGSEGDNVFNVSYTPTDTTNYKVVTGIEVTIHVSALVKLVITAENNMETVYNTQQQGPNVSVSASGNTITSGFTLSYQYKLSTSSTYTGGLPTNAGSYLIKINCSGSGYSNADEVIVNYTINKEKVKFIATNFETNYNENIRTWEDHKNYLESKLSFTTLENVPVVLDGYEIVSMNNGYYGYGTDATSYKTIDNVAGSVYIVHVDFTNGNYEIVGNDYFIYTYRTAVVDSTYYTIEEALSLGKDITLAGSVTSNISYVVTSTCNLDDDLYPYSSRSFSFSKVLYVPYTNQGKTAFATYENTVADTTYTCSALTITNRVSITFSGTVNVCAKVAAYGISCNHGVLYNDGTLTFQSGASLYAYGYVKGNGLITLSSGSKAQDLMRFWDYGSATTLSNVNSAGAWPITIWTIHNISCPTKIMNGATYSVYTATYGTLAGFHPVTVTIIGKTSDSNCLFKPQSSASAEDYILKYTAINEFGDASNATIKSLIQNIENINGSNQEQGQIDMIEMHGKYQDAVLSISISSVTVKSSTEKPFVIPFMSIKLLEGTNLLISNASYVFGLGTHLDVEKGATLTVNNGYVATDKLTGTSPTVFKYIASYCKNKVNSYIKANGIINGTGSIGGIIKCDEENAILNISKYNISSIKTKNTNSPYYYETTNYQAIGTIKNSSGTIENNVAFSNGNVYASFLENSTYYFEVNNNYNTFTINYYVDGTKVKTQEITVVNTDTYVVVGNEYIVSKDYYIFMEWLDSNGNELGTNGNNILTTSNSSINLYASFELKNYHFSYGVMYNGVDISNDVTYTSLIDTFTIDSFVDNKISITTVASYNGKYFDGWYLGIDKSSNIKLTQITKNQFIKFVETTGFDTIPFYGEFADTEYFSIAIVDSANNTINALYTIPQGTSLNDNGINIDFDSNSYDNNSSFPSYLANFSSGSNTYTIDQIKDYAINGNIVFTAQWLDKYTIDLKNYNNTVESTIYCVPNGKVVLPDGENYYDIASSGASETSGYYSNKIFSAWNVTLDGNGLFTCTSNTSINAIYTEEQYCKITFSVDAATINIYGDGVLDGTGSKGTGATSKVSMNGVVYFTFTYSNTGEGTTQSCQLNGTEITANTNYTITKNSKVVIKSTPKECVIEGTLITLADGTLTAVENIKAGDLVKVFNHETGEWDVSYVMFNDAEELATYNVINLYFSDGSYVGVVSEHGFFDLELMKYVYITEENYMNYVGHRFVAEDGVVTLIDAYVTQEVTRVYSPVTAVHLNLITNGILSMPGGVPGLFNIFEYGSDLKYVEELKNNDIETYGLLDYSFFEDLIPYDVYVAFNGKYLGISIAKGLLTEEQIALYVERYGKYW